MTNPLRKVALFAILLTFSANAFAQKPMKYQIASNDINRNSRNHIISAYLVEKTTNKEAIAATVNDIVAMNFLKEKNFHLQKIFLYPSEKNAVTKDSGYHWLCLYEKWGNGMAKYDYKPFIK